MKTLNIYEVKEVNGGFISPVAIASAGQLLGLSLTFVAAHNQAESICSTLKHTGKGILGGLAISFVGAAANAVEQGTQASVTMLSVLKPVASVVTTSFSTAMSAIFAALK